MAETVPEFDSLPEFVDFVLANPSLAGIMPGQVVALVKAYQALLTASEANHQARLELERKVVDLEESVVDVDADQVLALAGPHWVSEEIKYKLAGLQAEVKQLRNRLLSAAGDDLCRLSQKEIRELSSGAVQIPPKEEFLASCERFHAQIAGEAGVLHSCLTLAQLIAENERLTAQLREFADYGIKGVDMNPSMDGRWTTLTWYDYLEKANELLRERAQAALQKAAL